MNRLLDKRKKWLLLGSLAALMMVPGSPFLRAGDDVLTLETAIRMALARNERALTANQEFAAADARVRRARAYFLPTLNTTGTYTRRPFEVKRTVGENQIIIQKYDALAGVAALNLTIFDANSIPAFKQATSDRNAERYASLESKRQLSFEVSNAFLAALSVDHLLVASQRRFEYASQALNAARARYAAGLVSVNDVTRAELEYATAEMGITQVQGQVETTYLELGFLLDDQLAGGKKLKVPEFLLEASLESAAPVEDLVVQAQERRLDLNELRWRARAQHALVLGPLLKWVPSLAFTGQYRYTNEAGLTGRSTNWNVGLTMTWAVFDGFARNAEYSERKALAAVADLNVKSSLRGIELDVRDALSSLSNQKATLKQAQVAHEVAQKNAAQVTELYRQGLSTALEVADANVQLFEAEVQLVRERYGLGITFLNLEAALGLDPFGKEPKL